MKSKERVLTTLTNKQPHRVPIFEEWINESSLVKLAKLLLLDTLRLEAEKDTFGEERFEILNLYSFFVERLELDTTCYVFSMGFEKISEDHGRDRYGTIYRLSKHGEPFPIEGPIADPSDVKGLDMVSKLRTDDFA